MTIIKQPASLEKRLVEELNPKPRLLFRFRDLDHYTLVKSAADHSGLTLNGWICQATLSRARADLDLK